MRIEPRAEQEKAAENRENWRDLKAGCWYEGEIVPDRQRSPRQQDKAQREGTVLRAKNKKYFCDIDKAEQFGKLLWATGCAVGADRARILVFICDGAIWIWNLIALYFPNAMQIVDWYLAADRLKRIAEEVFSGLTERQAWLKEVTEDLWQGSVESVIEACQTLAKKSNLAKQSLAYYGDNLGRMRYAHDFEGALARFVNDAEAPLPVAYISFPSAKDPSFTERHPGHATIEVVTMATYEGFARWEGERWHRRGEEYDALKARLAARLLDALYAEVPQARGNVAVAELSTPLSTRHFANYSRGEIYGLAHDPARFEARALRARTPVPGLWLTGQDIGSCGVGGALAGGYLTSSAIAGRSLMPSGPSLARRT